MKIGKVSYSMFSIDSLFLGVLKISIPGNLTTEIAGAEGVFPGTVSVHEDLSVGQVL